MLLSLLDVLAQNTNTDETVGPDRMRPASLYAVEVWGLEVEGLIAENIYKKMCDLTHI